MVEFFGELKEKLGQVQSPGKYQITQQRRSVLPFFYCLSSTGFLAD